MITKELADYLAQHYRCKNNLADKFLSGIEVGISPLNTEKLFIIDENEALSVEKQICTLILCRDITTFGNRTNSIYIETEKSVQEVYLQLSQWWSQKTRVNEIKMHMYRTLNEKPYLDILLDIAFEYLENPLLIMDHTYHLVAFRKKDIPVPTPWQTLINTRMYDRIYMNDAFYEGQLKSLHSRDAIKFKLEEYDDYVCSIICNDTFMGSVSLLALNRPVSENDLEILKTLADIIGIKLGQTIVYPNGTDYHYSQIIIDLLNGRVNGEKDLNFRMHAHKWHANRRNRILLFSTRIKDESLLNNIKKSFSALYPNIKNIIFDDNIVILAETELLCETSFAFEDFCTHYNVQAGVSESFDNLLDIQIYYQQAKAALHYGRCRNNTEHAYYYRDFIIEDIAEHLCTSGPFQQFCHPAVIQLLEYDKSHNSDFSETFFTYIEQNRSVSKTSTILHQHKNTVNYRIQRIKEISGLDLTDFKELTHIYLTYKLLLAHDDNVLTLQADR